MILSSTDDSHLNPVLWSFYNVDCLKNYHISFWVSCHFWVGDFASSHLIVVRSFSQYIVIQFWHYSFLCSDFPKFGGGFKLFLCPFDMFPSVFVVVLVWSIILLMETATSFISGINIPGNPYFPCISHFSFPQRALLPWSGKCYLETKIRW